MTSAPGRASEVRVRQAASLARLRRAAHFAQLAIDLLGSTQAADEWLSSPSKGLDGKAPCEMRYDADGARRVALVLLAHVGIRRARQVKAIGVKGRSEASGRRGSVRE